MKNDFATLEEIIYAESLLLPSGKSFEEDKIKIILCNESKPIKACPGSGKTTTLLAKLAILANRMPLGNNQGICVLTHTNVAINEIKSKLGHKSDILFGYPNHFGTIQSFVDKFLAIPYYRSVFDISLNEISDDYFTKNIVRSYWARMSLLSKSNQIELSTSIKYFFTVNKTLLTNLRIILENDDFELFDIKNNSKVILRRPNPQKSKRYVDWNDNLKLKIKNWIIETIKNVWDYYGTLSFFDAYNFSQFYSSEFPQLKNFISTRFKYLFIDEMQDTDTHQLQIIEKIFDMGKTIIQYFGDPHQAIFNKAKAEVVWNPDMPLPINTSKRFGENIASVLRTVCIESNSELKANDEINSLKSHLIIYDDPEKVLLKYCELVTTLEIELYNGEKKTVWELSFEENRPIKAVGWVGEPNREDKDVDQLTIQSYFKPFRKNIKKKEKVNYDSLKSFLMKQENASVKDYSNNIIKALVHILSTENKKMTTGAKRQNYTKTNLFAELKDQNPDIYSNLNMNLAVWSYKLHLSEGYDLEVTTAVKAYINNTFLKHFGISNPNKYTTDFLENEPSSEITDKQLKANNTFIWEDNNNVKIELGTIHSVKGETHIATLLLETCYQGDHESERIMDQLLGISYKMKSKDTYRKETLKMAYVAMSRPKYLLCMAIKKERIQAILDDPVKKGHLEMLWELK